MNWRNITAKDLGKVTTKLSLEPSSSQRRVPHPIFWYILDGKKTLRITMPNVHGGSGSMSTGFLKKIQSSLHLNPRQFEELAECPLTPDEFEQIIREKLEPR
jgi:hypothetical protein